MKNFKAIILSVLVFCFSFGVPYYALFADFSVPTNDYTEAVVAVPTQGVQFYQPLGIGLTGTATDATFNFNVSVGSGGDLWSQLEILQCANQTEYDNAVAGSIGSGCNTSFQAGGFPQNQFTGTGNKQFDWNGSRNDHLHFPR